ncbi:hypothetical protein PCANC_07193 [Puccinia coronata f. sp. avenae]|uniref:Uncharacterized protein n=1 Tax=Puccinia coronata f. sp. avenae TaxID=200324 RepID=A0A2N5RZ51_9BASI|nr:hypothetical protein PCANC_27324 [Puccinia coronata f. sp. avenae]PLW53512.1 hypothetical protein PCANC_07193 [Puccinia coronata f. sp. avenae]
MNFMLNLFLIATELAVSCRADLEWNPLEGHWGNWNEENQRLLEYINTQSTSSEDVDDDFFEGLPDNLEEYFMAHVDAANEGLKITDRSLGQVPSPNNSLEYIAPRNLPLLGEIGMNAEEGGFYRLVFTRDLFHFPKSDDSRLPSRIYMIEGIIKKRAAESPSNPPGLVIKSDEMKTFMEPFKRAFSQTPGGKKAPKRSDLKRTFSQTCSDKKLPKTSDLAATGNQF